EDGIRDKLVTGVQTCALPIYDTKRLTPRNVACTFPHAGSSRFPWVHRAPAVRDPRSGPLGWWHRLCTPLSRTVLGDRSYDRDVGADHSHPRGEAGGGRVTRRRGAEGEGSRCAGGGPEVHRPAGHVATLFDPAEGVDRRSVCRGDRV